MLALWISLAHAGSVELILNDPVGRTRPADTCDVRLCTSLVERIDAAEHQIDLAIYGLRDQTAVLTALARAKERGVRIRAVVDRDVNGDNYYSSTPDLVALLGEAVHDDELTDRRTQREKRRQGDVQHLCDQPMGFQGPPQCLAFDVGDTCITGVHASREPLEFQGDIMHHKFAVFDGSVVWMGSTNWSNSGTGGYNANLVVVATDRSIANWYTREFEHMWMDNNFHHDKPRNDRGLWTELDDGTKVTGWFSPQDKPMTRAVVPAIQKAKTSIDIAVFFLTHKAVAHELIEAKKRGVKVRVILDATAAGNGYTKHEVLRAAGIPVKVENWGGKMHAKSAVIDGKVVITGSMNWTSAGEGGNDENTLIFESEAMGAQYAAWFEKLWTSIPDKWLKGRPDPESKNSTTACSDGSDNDFDHLADGKDPGCGSNPPPLPELPPVHVYAKRGDTCPEPGADGY